MANVDGAQLMLSALDKLEEPPSLVALMAVIAAGLPREDLPELLLEKRARTGFARGFTHARKGGARAGNVVTSICAVLLAESCNTGFRTSDPTRVPGAAPIAAVLGTAELYPSRNPNWANATLVAAQNRIPLARLGRRRWFRPRGCARRAGLHDPFRVEPTLLRSVTRGDLLQSGLRPVQLGRFEPAQVAIGGVVQRRVTAGAELTLPGRVMAP